MAALAHQGGTAQAPDTAQDGATGSAGAGCAAGTRDAEGVADAGVGVAVGDVGAGAASATEAAQPLYTLRPVREGDYALISSLLASEGMDIPPDWDAGTVAVNAQDEPVGFIRIHETSHGPHVAPVAVFSQWRGLGVGRALMNYELVRRGPLKLVARGSSVPFYRALGCREISFEDVSNELEEDCSTCPYIEQCAPVPFIMEHVYPQQG